MSLMQFEAFADEMQLDLQQPPAQQHRSGITSLPAASVPAAELMAAMLEELDLGVLLLDQRQHLRFANRSALRQLSISRALRLDAEVLRSCTAEDQARLHRALQRAFAGRRALFVAHGQGWLESAALVPLRDHVLVVLGGTGKPSALSLHFYCQEHGLTLSEALVLAAICNGKSPLKQAVDRSVSISTIRTQLASIRGKTNARSLMHLVRQVAALPPLASAG